MLGEVTTIESERIIGEKVYGAVVPRVRPASAPKLACLGLEKDGE